MSVYYISEDWYFKGALEFLKITFSNIGSFVNMEDSRDYFLKMWKINVEDIEICYPFTFGHTWNWAVYGHAKCFYNVTWSKIILNLKQFKKSSILTF